METKTVTRSASQKALTNQKSEGEKDDAAEDVLGKWLSGIFPYIRSLYLQVNISLHVEEKGIEGLQTSFRHENWQKTYKFHFFFLHLLVVNIN